MVKIHRDLAVCSFFLLVLIIVGCSTTNSGSKGDQTITGTKGITMEFIDRSPQDSYWVGSSNEPISVMLNIRNEGTYPRGNEPSLLNYGQVYLSGFDPSIISIENYKSLSGLDLTSASLLYPEGGFDIVEFRGYIYGSNMMVNTFDPTILATVCYPYMTRLGASVCIDPFSFDDRQDKVCQMGSQSFSSQGAPVAITKIDQEASSDKIQFKITIKNVGGGDIIRYESLSACDPISGSDLQNNDFDKIILRSITLGTREISYDCGPFADGSNNVIRLYDGEGFIICSADMSMFGNIKTAFTTPLNIELMYGYRSTVSKSIKISKITGMR